MTPESKLNWSTVKPTFEDVKGKQIDSIRSAGDRLLTRGIWTVECMDDYEVLFGDKFICYADLSAPVSPLPLWVAGDDYGL